MKTENDLSKSDRRKSMTRHMAGGVNDGVLVAAILGAAVLVPAILITVVAAASSALAVVSVASAAAGGAAVVLAAGAFFAVASGDPFVLHKNNIPDTLAKKCRNFGRVLGVSVSLLCGLAAGMLTYGPQPEKRAALPPVPVTEMASADLLVCPKGMMAQAFNTPVSQAAPVAASVNNVPALKAS